MLRDILRVNHAAVPGEGEDSLAFWRHEQGAFLCVTDGCGGLGSRRYEALNGRSGAYLASRLAARTFERWVQERLPMPRDPQEALLLCAEAERELFDRLKAFADAHCQENGRILGSMQRRLPTTLCAACVHGREAGFWWSGDSRGYVMDAAGLRQYTKDHVRGEADAFETLYRDAPLSNLLSADRPGRIQHRHVTLTNPSLVIAATDGVYGSLPAPMEVEMLLLDTLRLSASMAEWQKKLQRQIAHNAQDDAALLLTPVGFDDFECLKAQLLPRRETLQKQFITPLRRHRGDLDYLRAKWRVYRQRYDCTEEGHA